METKRERPGATRASRDHRHPDRGELVSLDRPARGDQDYNRYRRRALVMLGQGGSEARNFWSGQIGRFAEQDAPVEAD